MSKTTTVSFSRLILYHGEIGLHRGRSAGFGEVFGFSSLRELPFVKLAGKVKEAYHGTRVPSHDGWGEQRDALRYFVEKGRDGIYAIDTKPIRVEPNYYRHYYLKDGHHRALALYVLGEGEVRVRVDY